MSDDAQRSGEDRNAQLSAIVAECGGSLGGLAACVERLRAENARLRVSLHVQDTNVHDISAELDAAVARAAAADARIAAAERATRRRVRPGKGQDVVLGALGASLTVSSHDERCALGDGHAGPCEDVHGECLRCWLHPGHAGPCDSGPKIPQAGPDTEDTE